MSVQAALQSIAAANGGVLKPEHVVAAARDPNNPLHKEFTWDNDEAAAAWRLEQARTLIRSVKVVVHTETKTLRSVAYVRDPRCPSDVSGYVSVSQLRRDDELAREAMIAEFDRIKQHMERVRRLGAALNLQNEVATELADLYRRFEQTRDRVMYATA